MKGEQVEVGPSGVLRSMSLTMAVWSPVPMWDLHLELVCGRERGLQGARGTECEAALPQWWKSGGSVAFSWLLDLPVPM